MLPFVLYLVAAAVTGLHIYTLLLLAFYGGSISALEFLALLGSFGLLIAAYVSLFSPSRAGRIALIAALLLWSFYAPAIATLVRNHAHKTQPSHDVTQPNTRAAEVSIQAS
jgi:hypothetical protein